MPPKKIAGPSAPKAETSAPRRSKAGGGAVKYKEGDRILCLHEGSLYYDAKIISKTDTSFEVHYQGWNRRYDEFVAFNDVDERFKEYTNEAALEAKRLQKEARNKQNKRRTLILNKSTTSTPDLSAFGASTPGGTATSSRSSTPLDPRQRIRDGSYASITDQHAAKRGRYSAASMGTPSSLSIVPPSHAGLIGQSVTSALAQQSPHDRADGLLSTFPPALFTDLIEDKTLIEKGLLPSIPSQFSADDIVAEYKETIVNENEDANLRVEYGQQDTLMHATPANLLLCADGILDYFNAALRSRLLYGSEWETFDEYKDRSPKKNASRRSEGNFDDDFRPSKYYGYIHLVRCLCRFQELSEEGCMSREIRESVFANIHDLAAFLGKNSNRYWSKDQYVPA